jgi:predicted RNA-binding protein YlxR (DUF448 family)
MKRGHVPLRICKGCGQRLPQEKLVRFVLVGGQLQEDITKKMVGRGAYCCRNEQCRRRFTRNKKMLRRAFRLQA